MTSLTVSSASRPPGPRGPRRRASARLTLIAIAAAALTGCGSPGELHSAGRAPTAAAPAVLWPERDVIAPPEMDVGFQRPRPVMGLAKLPSRDIRKADAREVLRLDAKSNDEPAGEDLGQVPEDEWPTVADCLKAVPGSEDCEIQPARYHDLTRDGSPELIMGVDLARDIFEVRAYTVADGAVTRILVAGGNARSVEVAEGQLIIREPDGAKGYESSTIYRWDGEVMEYQGHLIQQRSAGLPERSAFRSTRTGTGPSLPRDER